MPRVFISLPLNTYPFLLDFYQKIQVKFGSENRINWVAPNNLHLTLKFLGEISVQKIRPVSDALSEIASESKYFSLTAKELGYFGKKQNPLVFWLGFKPNSQLSFIQKRIDEKLGTLGFPVENREFTPHLTLARLKKLTDIEPFQNVLEMKPPETHIHITRLDLMESILKKDGPVYHPIQIFKIGN